jgi:hypothetical protein
LLLNLLTSGVVAGVDAERYIERVRTIPNGVTEPIPEGMTVRRKLVGNATRTFL